MLMEAQLRSTTATQERPPPRPIRSGGGDEDSAAVAELAGVFQNMLTASRSASRARFLSANGKASPSQMFEAPATGGQGRRPAALREDNASTRASVIAGDRMDTTSVSARKASGNAHGEAAESRRTGGAWGASQGGANGERAAIKADAFSAGRMSHRGLAMQTSPDGSGPVDRSEPAGRLATGHHMFSSDASAGAGSKATVSETTPVATSAPAVAGAAVVRAGVQQPGDVAHQIADNLSAGRVGQVESARAVASAPGSDSAGPHTGQQASADKASPDRPPRGQRAPSNTRGSDVTRASKFDQLVRSIRLGPGGRQSSARLLLEPPELGRVQVDIRMEDDQLLVKVRTESAEARELLSGRAAQLRAALASHGINVDRFDVTADLSSDVPAEPPGQERPGSAASSGRDHPREETGRSTNVVSSNDTEEIAEDDAVPATTAVGNVRLDIRV